MPDLENVNVSFGPALRSKVRAELAGAYPDEAAETLDHSADLLLRHASLDAAGKVRFDSGVALIAPRLSVPLTQGDSETAKLMRSVEVMHRRAPLPGRKVQGDPKAAIAALPQLGPNASEDVRLARAVAITRILENAGIGADLEAATNGE